MIISFTFDDGLDCHLDAAMPLLERHGWRGTFFVNLNSPGFCGRLPEWQEAAQRGHELGNHTIFHPAVSGKGYVTEGNCLEKYTLDRMRMELGAANQLLTALDGQKERTFAYPCCNPVLGRSGWTKRLVKSAGLDRTRLMGWINRWPVLDLFSHEQDYSCLLPALFVAARIGGYPAGNQSIEPINRFRVPCISADGLNSFDLIKQFERARQRSPWIIFMFHGIGGGHHLSCATADFEGLLNHVGATPKSQVLTFVEAARRYSPKA